MITLMGFSEVSPPCEPYENVGGDSISPKRVKTLPFQSPTNFLFTSEVGI